MQRHRSAAHATGRGRPGIALVAVLALLTLAAALLAGSFASAVSLARATRSASASAHATTLARRAAAEAFAAWQEAGDSLALGAFQDGEVGVSQSFGRTVVRTRVQRIAPRLYTVTVDVRVGAGAVPLAHRRSRLVLERSANFDSAGARVGPHPIARWSVGGFR